MFTPVIKDALSREGADKLKKMIEDYWATRQDEFYMPSVFTIRVRNFKEVYAVVSDMNNGQPQRRKHKDVK